MTDSPRLHLFGQHFPKARGLEHLVVAGMKLVEIHIIALQGAQASFNLIQDIGRLVVRRSIEEAVEVMAEFRPDNPILAIAANRAANQSLGKVIAITLGGVDQIDARLAATVEQRIHLGLREVFSPFATELPGADPDDRYFQPGL